MKKKASSIILLNEKEEIILQKRDDREKVYFRGCWGLIGGAAEEDETAEQCIRREFYEETGECLADVQYVFQKIEHCEETIFFSYIDSKKKLQCFEGEEIRAFPIKDIRNIKISNYHQTIITEFFDKYYKKSII